MTRMFLRTMGLVVVLALLLHASGRAQSVYVGGGGVTCATHGVPYAITTDTLQCDPNLTWDSGNRILQLAATDLNSYIDAQGYLAITSYHNEDLDITAGAGAQLRLSNTINLNGGALGTATMRGGDAAAPSDVAGAATLQGGAAGNYANAVAGNAYVQGGTGNGAGQTWGTAYLTAMGGAIIRAYDADLGDYLNLLTVTGNVNAPALTIAPSGDGTVALTANALKVTMQTPASAAATCTKDTIAFDTGFVYICTATSTWKRVAIATW